MAEERKGAHRERLGREDAEHGAAEAEVGRQQVREQDHVGERVHVPAAQVPGADVAKSLSRADVAGGQGAYGDLSPST